MSGPNRTGGRADVRPGLRPSRSRSRSPNRRQDHRPIDLTEEHEDDDDDDDDDDVMITGSSRIPAGVSRPPSAQVPARRPGPVPGAGRTPRRRPPIQQIAPNNLPRPMVPAHIVPTPQSIGRHDRKSLLNDVMGMWWNQAVGWEADRRQEDQAAAQNNAPMAYPPNLAPQPQGGNQRIPNPNPAGPGNGLYDDTPTGRAIAASYHGTNRDQASSHELNQAFRENDPRMYPGAAEPSMTDPPYPSAAGITASANRIAQEGRTRSGPASRNNPRLRSRSPLPRPRPQNPAEMNRAGRPQESCQRCWDESVPCDDGANRPCQRCRANRVRCYPPALPPRRRASNRPRPAPAGTQGQPARTPLQQPPGPNPFQQPPSPSPFQQQPPPIPGPPAFDACDYCRINGTLCDANDRCESCIQNLTYCVRSNQVYPDQQPPPPNDDFAPPRHDPDGDIDMENSNIPGVFPNPNAPPHNGEHFRRTGVTPPPAEEPFAAPRHAFNQNGGGFGGNIEAGQREGWEQQIVAQTWIPNSPPAAAAPPTLSQGSAATVSVPYRSENQYPAPQIGDHARSQSIQRPDPASNNVAANQPLQNWASYVYDDAGRQRGEYAGPAEWPWPSLNRIADSHVHDPAYGLDSARPCDELRLTGDNPFADYDVDKCGNVPTKKCEVNEPQEIYPQRTLRHIEEPFHSCKPCRDVLEAFFAARYTDLVEQTKMYLCGVCANKAMTQNVAWRGLCLCMASLQCRWVCSDHRQALVREENFNLFVAASEDYLIRNGILINGQNSRCTACFERFSMPQARVWSCKICREYVYN
ncbi:hypothetical protein LZ554_003439 [Drepanopeziza brunnea f. sp. 'monogermtubi']|nr:hypothetical protein LZ554_003439 [Drepanopeziza brunnea f. sp. 'monogermtubi']